MSNRRSHPLLEVTLPENVMFDVFSRLPVKTIITCKCVCKRWRGLVSDPYFVHLHLSRSSRDQEALMIVEYQDLAFCNPQEVALKWVEMEPEHEHLDTIKSLKLKQCEPRKAAGSFALFAVGSLNGLVLCWSMNDGSLYMFNPVLEEYMTFPPFPPAPLRWCFMSFGYGFGVSTAGEYKVVHILINPDDTAVEIQVHTLGTNHWRRPRQTPHNNLNSMKIQCCHGVYLNSHLYWLCDQGQIYDFDLSTETSDLLPYPLEAPGDNQEPKRMLGVLKGRLSYMCWCSSGGVEVWVRKEEESANWYKEISVISSFSQLRPWRPLCLIDGVKEGEVPINPPETAVWVVEIKVNTLGSGTDQWRSLRQTPNSLNLGRLKTPSVYLNSLLYWLIDDHIYHFDFSRVTPEYFHTLRLQGDNQESDRILGVLKGRLSCIYWCFSWETEVWVMKEESNWYKEITVIKPFIQLFPWRPLCLIDGLEGTSVLLVHVEFLDKSAAFLNTNKILIETPIFWINFSSIMTYRPSFVKLDNFGLERVHAMYNHNPHG
ncbi:hypothetical protein SSX86_005699 [Deinandra increscens subsp. villosa]|uniref:F-box domain-containing protein n=1 Tax=Deinandra increscens subsp. villosa TaxID=3103831 RepID=A0AAP0DR14_9ASTR